MVFSRVRSGLPLVAGVVALAYAPIAAAPLDETVNILQQWVETERKISSSQAEWEANKASMENLISIYEREIETLGELIASAEDDTSAAEARRAELLAKDDRVKAIENKVTQSIAAAEESIKSLQPLLPAPLQEELGPLFNTLPEDSSTTKLPIGQRIQPIVAILTQVQKFNQVVTVEDEFREFGTGRTIQTKTIYFGLGAAYYVDDADEHAGVGILGENGWEWKDDDSLVPAIRNFVNIFSGTQQATYVELPLSVN